MAACSWSWGAQNYLVDPSRCGRSWGCGNSRSYDGSIENVVRSRICGVSCGGSCTYDGSIENVVRSRRCGVSCGGSCICTFGGSIGIVAVQGGVVG